jgi:hypothetical protein
MPITALIVARLGERRIPIGRARLTGQNPVPVRRHPIDAPIGTEHLVDGLEVFILGQRLARLCRVRVGALPHFDAVKIRVYTVVRSVQGNAARSTATVSDTGPRSRPEMPDSSPKRYLSNAFRPHDHKPKIN